MTVKKMGKWARNLFAIETYQFPMTFATDLWYDATLIHSSNYAKRVLLI